MTDQHDTIPGPAERALRNHALRVHHIESGFFDADGRVAPWPDDFDDWQPERNQMPPPAPGEPPF